MRRERYEDYAKKRRAFVASRARLGYGRKPSRRPRDEEERALLIRLDKSRLERWMKDGRLVKLGWRRWRFVPDARPELR